MIKIFTWLLNIFMAFIVVGIIALVGIITLVDPNQFKDLIRKQVSSKTGRILTIEGPIYWCIDPNLSLETYDIVLGNARTFPNEFMTLKRARLSANLLSIFSGKILVDVELQGLNLNLNRNALGHNNWADLQILLNDNQLFQNRYFVPYNIFIDDASVSWQDLFSHQQLKVKDLNFNAKKLSQGMAGFSVPIHFSFKTQDQNIHSAEFNLNAEWFLNQKLKQIDVHNLAINAHIDNLPPTTLTGEMHIQELSQNPTIQGKLEGAGIHLQSWLNNFSIPSYAQGLATVSLNSSFKYKFPSLEVVSFKLFSENHSILEGNFKILDHQKSFTKQTAEGYVHGKGLYIDKYPIKEIRTSFKTKDGILSFDQMTAEIANTKHQGKGQIDFRSDTPHITLSDQMDSFDINDFLALVNEKDKIYGKFHANTQLTTHGKTLEDCFRNLAGLAQVTLIDGKIQGIDLNPLLKHAQSTVNMLSEAISKKQPINIGAALTAELGEWKQQAVNYQQLSTPFRMIETTLNIENGRLQTSDFKLTHPEYTVSCQGTLDLLHKNIEYQASALLNRTAPENAPDIAIFLKDTPLTIKLNGPFNNLSVRPELGHYAEGALKLLKPEPESMQKIPAEPTPSTEHTLEKLFGYP